MAVIDDGHGRLDQGIAGSQSLGGPPMQSDAIFRIQSMTKPITTVTALRLVARGGLDLDDPVDRLLPELADRQVLRSRDGNLDDTVPAVEPIRLRHLLTCSGYGMGSIDSPLGRAMAASGVEAGPHPFDIDGYEWLKHLAELPLAHQPGQGWRYHHGLSILGLLLDRATDDDLAGLLRKEVFDPLGMADTGFWTPDGERERLPAAYRLTDEGWVEVEPRGGGANSADPGYLPWHEELVSTADDYLALARMLRARGTVDGTEFLPAEFVEMMTTDQLPDAAKTPESFGPEFWSSNGWGFGVGVENGENGSTAGRFGWSGGLGTDFTVDPATGRITLMLTQTELGPTTFPAVLALR